MTPAARRIMLFVLGLCLSATSGAQDVSPQIVPTPTTRPAGAPTAASRPATDVRQVATIVRGLLDADPKAREAARRHVLGLAPIDVPAIASAVRAIGPAQRGSAALNLALHDALIHIHVRDAKERYIRTAVTAADFDTPPAFMGFTLGVPDANALADDYGRGVIVGPPIAGFNAYEILREGDLLVAMRTAQGMQRLTTYTDLFALTRQLDPGDPVELYILRGGRVERAEFRMDRRIETRSDRWQEMSAEAKRAAELAWETQIVPALASNTGGAATAG